MLLILKNVVSIVVVSVSKPKCSDKKIYANSCQSAAICASTYISTITADTEHEIASLKIPWQGLPLTGLTTTSENKRCAPNFGGIVVQFFFSESKDNIYSLLVLTKIYQYIGNFLIQSHLTLSASLDFNTV